MISDIFLFLFFSWRKELEDRHMVTTINLKGMVEVQVRFFCGLV
jgi:hypothetical protein